MTALTTASSEAAEMIADNDSDKLMGADDWERQRNDQEFVHFTLTTELPTFQSVCMAAVARSVD